MAGFEQGTIQLYTGDGKGKTTAALGAALRALGHGKRVAVVQFMKGRLYGELAAAAHLPGLTIEQHGRDEFVDPKRPEPVDLELAEKGWRRAEELLEDDSIDMLILDEINVAVAFGLVALERVTGLMRRKPPGLELILTGRYAPKEMVELADTVTEMREIKHHYRAGVQARKGVEY
ncbi:MAG: cob(I)yrinic acid a,c-diamide adenosyltransferase [Candidatus Latescibacterota bacterium]|jgi:cob(I)alamin adenosyltransferase|nr:MAG: cob(I)yrinic acid a,c-diamide adenosyltransferase [Candidatus Latescibacterota bacterium]